MDEMRTENERGQRVITRRNLLRGASAAAGVALGKVAFDWLFPPPKAPENVAAPSPSPTQSFDASPSVNPTPTKSPTPKPTATPEILTGELPDVLSSTDAYEKYFAQEKDLAKINEMIKQQQAEENTKAKAENREPKIICLFVFNPVETAKLGKWTIRKLLASSSRAVVYAFLLPQETLLNVPFEGIMSQRGFSNNGRSLDINGENGYRFWMEYFGDAQFNQRAAIAGENYLKITKDTQIFNAFGSIDMGGETTIFGLVRKTPTSPFSDIKWLTNEKGQIIHVQ